MIPAYTKAGDWTRVRWSVLAVLATLLVGGCNADNADTLAPSELPDAHLAAGTPVGTTTAAAGSSAAELASSTAGSLPYGPAGLWKHATLRWGPGPFTASQNYISADSILFQIKAARNKGHRLVVAMAGGLETKYTTNGQFDMTKWKNRMNTYRTTAIKNAVAAAVSDGTIIANLLIDEPETKRWGSVLTKAMIDEMAAYVKDIFPMLTVGVNHGPPGYNWRSGERYRVVDYVLYQYNHFITSGNIVAWRNAVLDRAKVDGVTPALSLNILNGGRQDRDGTWDCTGPDQGGRGTRSPNCRMTPDQVRDWGQALAPYACFMMVWRYDEAYMSQSANQEAFEDLAAIVASAPPRSCQRP
jgi:hypothetical protein